MQKELKIRGPVKDLGDLLAIARSEGCKALHCTKVNVSPQVFYSENNYTVFVSPKNSIDVQTPQVVCGISKNV
jgi:hypothetical protein